MAHIFGNATVQLLRQQGPVAAADALAGKKYVLVYFSAHWCPPCRGFTPMLRAFHEKHHKRLSFDVLFVSSDNSAAEMMSYFTNAHGDWLALTLEDAQTIGRSWAAQHGLFSIPSLLVLENTPERRCVTVHGRDMVLRDPEALQFPWKNATAVLIAARRAFMKRAAAVVVVAVVLLCVVTW